MNASHKSPTQNRSGRGHFALPLLQHGLGRDDALTDGFASLIQNGGKSIPLVDAIFHHKLDFSDALEGKDVSSRERSLRVLLDLVDDGAHLVATCHTLALIDLLLYNLVFRLGSYDATLHHFGLLGDFALTEKDA